jgi:hypothetical protein
VLPGLDPRGNHCCRVVAPTPDAVATARFHQQLEMLEVIEERPILEALQPHGVGASIDLANAIDQFVLGWHRNPGTLEGEAAQAAEPISLVGVGQRRGGVSRTEAAFDQKGAGTDVPPASVPHSVARWVVVSIARS